MTFTSARTLTRGAMLLLLTFGLIAIQVPRPRRRGKSKKVEHRNKILLALLEEYPHITNEQIAARASLILDYEVTVNMVRYAYQDISRAD